MSRQENLEIANLQDCWAKLYFHLAKKIVDDLGVEGENALRQGIRNFGIDRGRALKKKHLETGLKINLYNLFTYYDLPGDKRFKRNKICLNSQERISETLVCPIANMWIDMDGKKLGRIYCEEFHHAMFSAYASKAQINLGKTITQEGDDYCHFAIYLRPSNMDSEERKISFEEFDSDFNTENVKEYIMNTAREGFNMLSIKLFYNIAEVSLDMLGEEVKDTLIKAVQNFAEDIAEFLKKKAMVIGENLKEEFLYDNCPISMDINNDKVWDDYNKIELKNLFEDNFYPVFSKTLNS